jgi:hypothetical protein
VVKTIVIFVRVVCQCCLIEVFLSLGGDPVLAGTLYAHRRRGTESATYVYSPSYLATPGAYALDPELPLTSGARSCSRDVAGSPRRGELVA